MKRKQQRREPSAAWLEALQAGAAANRERINQNLAAGRVWTDERRAAWKAKAAKSWTPAMREAARQRALARHAARKEASDATANV